MFEAFARERGYELSAHEPDLGTAKRPDYVMTCERRRCVVEVKEFAPTTRSLSDQRVGSTDLATVLKPIRSQLREAARQLKDVADLGFPLLVVLTNPRGAFVMLGEREMIWAMYGDPVVRMDIDRRTGAAVGEPQQGVGRNGRLARDHQYISAVAVIGERQRAADWYDEMNRRHADLPADERWELILEAQTRGERYEGTYDRADVYKTLSPSAIPLPDVLFDAPEGRVFEPNENGTAYVQVRGRVLD